MEIIKKLDLKSKILLASFLTLGALALLLNPRKEEVVVAETGAPAGPSVDTFIPSGYVLVPIELVNGESLNSLVGDMGGVVDLYLSSNEDKRKSVKVGSKLKLLRAPLNPQQYAVLVKDSESSLLLSYSGPYLAVVQNPDAKVQGVTQGGKASVRIEYQN